MLQDRTVKFKMNMYKTYFKFKRETRNIASYYHQYGVWRTVLRWLLRLGMLSIKVFFKKEYLTFFEFNLVNPAHEIKVDKTLDLLLTSREDIDKNYYDESHDRNLAIKCLERGDVLFTVQDNGKIMFSQWIIFKKIEIPAIKVSFDIPDTTAYMANLYTTPEYRGKKVASRAVPHLLKYLKDRGYQKVFILIDPRNEPSIRVNQKAGFRAYQNLFYMKFIMFFKFYYVKDSTSNRKKVFWSVGKTDQQMWNTFSKITPPTSEYQ